MYLVGSRDKTNDGTTKWLYSIHVVSPLFGNSHTTKRAAV